jgi:anti-sigma factor RsiW
MRSHPSKETLGAYVDGGFSTGRRARVEKHLAACETCRRYVCRLESVTAELAALPREIAPPADLDRPWLREDPEQGLPRVQPRATRSFSRIQRFTAAAVVILLAAAASLILVGDRLTDPDAAAGARGRRPVVTRPDLQSEAVARIRTYETASRQLAALYVKRHDALPAGTVPPVDASLASLDRAIASVEAALEAHPEAEYLQRMLVRRYETKIDLLRRALDERASA